MTRTILIHLNVAIPDLDERTPDEVADRVLEFVSSMTADPKEDGMLSIVCPLAEEV